MSNYPKIIKELIEKVKPDELRYFDLYFFMSGPSLEDVFEKIDKTMNFFSVYVSMEHLEDDLWEDSRYADKKEVQLCSRIEYRYHRRYEMPPPFNHWDSRNPWQQYYFAKDQDGTFYYAQGGSGSSGQSYNHGFYGHLFALLNRENPVPTYFFTYDSHNQFVFNRKENSLCLNSIHLVGNFQIDWEESKRILKDVNRIKR